MFKIAFNGNGATSGKMSPVYFDKKHKLPKNKFKRPGFVFMGWSTKKNNVVNMKHLQLGKVKYKDKAAIKLPKGKKITLYACWKGYGKEAAAYWARKITRDNSFTYGKASGKWANGRDRAHQLGCYFCGTTRKGVKRAPKGSRWEKTYCCNCFVFAALCHGANLFSKCKGGSTKPGWWLRLKRKGKHLYKKIGFNVKYSQLRPGDILLSGRHIIMFTYNKNKVYKISHAARSGWDKNSVLTQKVKGRIGTRYIALRYIGR